MASDTRIADLLYSDKKIIGNSPSWSKDFSQIAGFKDSYVFANGWDNPNSVKLPLWMLGFLY